MKMDITLGKVSKKVIFIATLAWMVISISCLNAIHAQVANITIDNPAPFGGYFGTVGGGVVYQSKIRTNDHSDGNMGLSVGLGNPQKFVGLALNFNVFGLSSTIGEDDNFGSGTLDIQINRSISEFVNIGGGVRNLAKWRSPGLRARQVRSYYFNTSMVLPLSRFQGTPFNVLFVTAGVGNGVFRLEKDFDFRTSGTFNVFASAAVQAIKGVNIITEWNGYDLNAGVSVFPFKKIPSLGGTVSVADLTRYGPKDRFIVMIGYALRFSNSIYNN